MATNMIDSQNDTAVFGGKLVDNNAIKSDTNITCGLKLLRLLSKVCSDICRFESSEITHYGV